MRGEGEGMDKTRFGSAARKRRDKLGDLPVPHRP